MKLNKTLILAGTALAGLISANAALAQSTATQDVESKVTEVVVKGKKAPGPIKAENGPKAKATIGQDVISRAAPGQTIIDTLNLVPGYNFTNNDAFGSSGGNVMMRGLDGSRISLTLDGVQLNDSGNYAIYSNQQGEPELICSASVATGATDVDSMTASATGGTVNYTTCKPTDEMSGVAKASVGDQNFKSLFLRFDSGKFGPFGTKLFLTYSGSSYDEWTRAPNLDPDINPHLQKNQYNFRVYQDIGDNGSFVSVSGQWNENRNHFMFGPSKPQADCITDPAAGGSSANVYPKCGYDFNSINGGNINPSNTGNIRVQSKWVLSDKLTLTVDPTFQYVLANGGGNSTLREDSAQLRGSLFSTVSYVDLNGNGLNNSTGAAGSTTAILDIYRPNTTNTHRYSLNTGLIYKLTDSQTLRFGASFDRARHRQTGEATLLDANLAPIDVFGGRNNPELRLKTADGSVWRRRDRFSLANVDVLSLEYRGRFIDDKLFISAGVRSQKMERQLNQYCYSPISGTGSTAPYCSTQKVVNSVTMSDGIKVVTLEGSATTLYFSPYSRKVSFDKTLPNFGVTWNFDTLNQVYATYAESMSSPRTDSYYGAVFGTPVPTSLYTAQTPANLTANAAIIAANTLSVANPAPETSQTIELGYRYRSANLQGTATVFVAKDHNRIVSAFDRDSGASIDRNIGDVDRSGFEASAAYRAADKLTLNGGFTYTKTEVLQDLEFAKTSAGLPRYLPTKGKQLPEMPQWMATFGANLQITSKLNLDVTAKYVGDRFTTDINDDVIGHFAVLNSSLRYDLSFLKPGTYIQLNGINLTDAKYYGSVSSQNNAKSFVDNTGATKTGTAPFINVGAPRTFILTLRTQF